MGLVVRLAFWLLEDVGCTSFGISPWLRDTRAHVIVFCCCCFGPRAREEEVAMACFGLVMSPFFSVCWALGFCCFSFIVTLII